MYTMGRENASIPGEKGIYSTYTLTHFIRVSQFHGMEILVVAIFILIGVIGGLSVGLAGFGITLVTLPALIVVFSQHLPHAIAVKMAIATTLACGMTAAISAVVLHIKNGNIQWSLFIRMASIYVCTAICGAYIVHYLPAHFIELFLGIVLITVATKLFMRTSTSSNNFHTLNPFRFVITILLAGFSNSMCGIATGTIAIPYLSKYYPQNQAAGTSIASTLVACTMGMFAYIYYGWNLPELPKYSVGYLYTPAFICIAIGVLIGTPLGYKLSGQINPKWIKYLLVSLVMISGVFSIFKGLS